MSIRGTRLFPKNALIPIHIREAELARKERRKFESATELLLGHKPRRAQIDGTVEAKTSFLGTQRLLNFANFLKNIIFLLKK